MASRTKPGSAVIRQARLAKAEEFWAVAHEATPSTGDVPGRPDAITSLLVLSGIAASDAICCARLGEYSIGENHNQAIQLLKQADQASSKHLTVLLGLKSKAGYSHLPVSADDWKRAQRAAWSLLTTARALS